jgi:MFS family permease
MNEFEARFDRISQFPKTPPPVSLEDDFRACGQDGPVPDSDPMLTVDRLRDYLVERIHQLEADNPLPSGPHDELTEQRRKDFCSSEANRILTLLKATPRGYPHQALTMTKQEFTTQLMTLASTVETGKVMPITISMLLVGSSVGIITPVMPFIVEHLGLTPGQFGMVVSAFALAKMAGNVPSAIFVERHGRKPFLVYSLSVIALGVGGIGLATSFEHLWVCRLLTGFGVAALSTAATMSITDISNPRNRATTMAPIMSAFAAGTALGPALGGILADQIGLNPTFYAVGISYIGLTAVNYGLLNETQPKPMVFDWQPHETKTTLRPTESVLQAVQKAVGQWAPLLSQPKVRNVVLMNGFYWVALAGSQMTLLPLLLTDPTGLNMTATQVGQVYMGMSLVQVLGNPLLAKGVDTMGKGRAIVCGCSLLSASMAILPWTNSVPQLAAVLGVWATGSTMLSTAPVAYISDHTDDATRAQAIALLRTSGDVGFLLGATSMGALADWTGNLDVALQSSAGILFVATSWFGVRQLLQAPATVQK